MKFKSEPLKWHVFFSEPYQENFLMTWNLSWQSSSSGVTTGVSLQSLGGLNVGKKKSATYKFLNSSHFLYASHPHSSAYRWGEFTEQLNSAQIEEGGRFHQAVHLRWASVTIQCCPKIYFYNLTKGKPSLS